MYIQPCLIKKNTAKLRKQLEGFGYVRAKLSSDDPNYDNDKEPWILCLYDVYICLDKEYYKEMVDDLEKYKDMIPEISTEVIDCKKNEKLFLEKACIEADIEFNFE